MVIVEDEAFVKIITMLNSNVNIPSHQTVARDIQRVYSISKKAVKQVIAEASGCTHEMLDGWSSPNVLSILGLTTTFMHNEEMKTIVLDCYK